MSIFDAFLLFVFGEFVIAGGFIFWSFIGQAWTHRKPISFFNPALCLATGIAIGTICMVNILGIRLLDIIAGRVLHTTQPYFYALCWAGEILSLSLIVWVAALRGGKAYSPGIWFGYLAFSFAWGLSCLGRI